MELGHDAFRLGDKVFAVLGFGKCESFRCQEDRFVVASARTVALGEA